MVSLVNFQYSERTEVLDYRDFFINTYRLTVNQPYGQFIYGSSGYIPGALTLRVPTGLLRFARQHPNLAQLDQSTLVSDRLTYHSLSDFVRVLHVAIPLLEEQLQLLEDSTTTMGYASL